MATAIDDCFTALREFAPETGSLSPTKRPPRQGRAGATFRRGFNQNDGRRQDGFLRHAGRRWADPVSIPCQTTSTVAGRVALIDKVVALPKQPLTDEKPDRFAIACSKAQARRTGGTSQMCFSAVASFLAAGTMGAIGVVAIARVREPRELPLAVTPVFFAVQQGIEGWLWLHLPTAPADPTSTILTYAFLFLAEVFWPVYAPIAAFLLEREPRCRTLMAFCVLVGVAVAGNLLWSILSHPHTAFVSGGHIVYAADQQHSDLLGLAYLIATGFAPVLSSHRTIIGLGAIILVGSAVAYAFYWEAFVSVWCFFAAAASGIVLFHFEAAHRVRLQNARS